jgi:hypothetical protein
MSDSEDISSSTTSISSTDSSLDFSGESDSEAILRKVKQLQDKLEELQTDAEDAKTEFEEMTPTDPDRTKCRLFLKAINNKDGMGTIPCGGIITDALLRTLHRKNLTITKTHEKQAQQFYNKRYSNISPVWKAFLIMIFVLL